MHGANNNGNGNVLTEAVRDFYKVNGNKSAKFQLDEYKKQLDFEIDVLRKNARHNEELIKIKFSSIPWMPKDIKKYLIDNL